MKLSIFFLLFSLNTIAQTTYYVWAKSGLILRSEPSSTSKKQTVIPFGTKIEEIDYINDEYQTDSILMLENPLNKKQKFYLKGNWQEITYKGQKGYIFDGFLSSFVPPTNEKYIDDYISNNYVKLDSTYKKMYPEFMNYKGCTKKVDVYEGGAYYQHLYFNDKKFNDGVLLSNYFNELYDFKNLDLEKAIGIEFFSTKNEFRVYSDFEGHHNYIISYEDGILILMSGGGC